MIQLKQNDKSKEGYFNILIGESLLSDSWALKPVLEPNYPFQYSAKGWACWKLATQTFEDFEPFSVISFNNLFSWMIKGHSIIFSIEINEDSKEELIVLTYYFSPNLTFWNEKYSFAQYFDEFERICKKTIEVDYEISFEESPSFRLEFYLKKFAFPIEEILASMEKQLKDIHEESVEILQTQFQDELVKSIFDFPEEMKVSCKQYLLYFAQFLQDLGINATSNLKEEAGKVLFSVTPTDDIEALDKIREALAVYLNLPASPIVYDESFAAMRLQQQVENLQHSQRMAVREIRTSERELRLAQTIIESQDKIIIQKDSIIEQQNKVIEKISSKSVMMDSLENKEELEEIYDGLKIGESEFLKKQLGIHLNPVTSLKTLGKKLIGKDDEIISLGLDEDT